MIKLSFLLCVLIYLVPNAICAQSDFDAGFLPKAILSKRLSEKTKWISSIESRQIIYDEAYQFSYDLIDLSSIYSVKTTLNQSFNFGYILRFRNSETIHRTFQHYNFVDKWTNLKIGHRIAFEQFYQTKKQTTYRTRYRLSTEIPLNGERVDVKELYFKFGNEYLYDFSDLEIRLTPYLGYQVSKKDKIDLDSILEPVILRLPKPKTPCGLEQLGIYYYEVYIIISFLYRHKNFDLPQN